MSGFTFGGTSAGGFGTGTTGFGGGGFGFGTQPKTTAATGFGLGFGQTAASTAPSFGFGAATTTASSAPTFGFGATTTSAAPSFGFGATTSTAPSFGFGSTTGTGFGSTTSAPTGFGGLGGFGATTGATGFGLGLNTATQAQQQQQQMVADPAAEELAKISKAVSQPQIFGDERDAVIAKWNQLQAHWGKGKGYYTGQNFVEFKPDNIFCKFKAVGYNCMPSGKNEDGLVALIIKHPVDMVKPQQQQALDTIHKILGNKPQHTVCAEAINQIPDDRAELVIYVMERPQMGPAKRCPATDLYNYLSSQQLKQQLVSQLDVETITAKLLTKEQLKLYLDHPPAGIDPLLWQQAILDNPDPEKMIPVPMIGFKELHKRLKYQDQQTKLHQQRLDLIAQDLTEFQNKQSNMLAKLDEYKRKHLELSHRLLQVIVKQEMHRKQGFAIQVDEEQLRVHLEAIQAELNHPTQFKGRLNELMSQIRMQNHLAASRSDVNYQIDPSMLHELKTLLKQQQEGLTHLIDIVKEDTQDLNVIEQGLTDTANARR
ncbi:nuclear pore complex protein Nup54-like [Mercenaria mercenaria]|uniref:nuclear pore complex protein Nup54-like n=1 Tax=Mercenaria mercenaria TaxID=6596 RepID=UPI00234EAE71|nr:nuclear pore complex protein Nup54-like [Mercenaria mercenaria]